MNDLELLHILQVDEFGSPEFPGSLGAIKTHIHRLRRQFAAAVRHEIMQTVSAPHEVDDELRQLRGVFVRLGQQPAL